MLSRGSEWAKWDLHLHSPMTHLQNNFGKGAVGLDAYCRAIADKGVGGIAVTNYFYFADDELELVRNGLRKAGCSIPVFGNLEFRIQQPNKNDEFINIHVLFSDSLSTSEINRRIGRLALINTRADGRAIHCVHEDVMDEKASHGELMVDPNALAAVLSHNFKPHEFLFVCCLGGYGNMRPAKPIAQEGRGASLASELDKKSDCFFGSRANIAFALDRSRYPGAKAKAVLTGSDAHSLNDVCATTVWIKSEPSFEGLRQVLYEPESRVSFLELNPSSVFDKPSFERIVVKGEPLKGQQLKFAEVSIPLNRDLVAIIGGRGTGKSLLTDVLWRIFHRPSKDDLTRYHDLVIKDSTVSFLTSDKDQPLQFLGDASNSLSYLHVRQGEIKSLAENAARLSAEVKRLIGVEEPAPSINSHESVKYVELKSRINSILHWLDETDEEGAPINNQIYQEQRIKDMEGKLSAITSTSNQNLITQIQAITSKKSEITRSIADIVDLQDTVLSSERAINRKIVAANINLKGIGTIPSHSFNSLINELDDVRIFLDRTLEDHEATSANLTKKLSEAGVTLDASGLVAKAELFQGAINEANECLKQISRQAQEMTSLLGERQAFTKAFLAELENEKTTIDLRFKALTDKNEQWSNEQNQLVAELLKDISVSGEIFFDDREFYRSLMETLNLSKFRSTGTSSSERKVRAYLPIKSVADLLKLINDEPIIDDELEIGAGIPLSKWINNKDYFVANPTINLQDLLFSPRHLRKYLTVRAKITYKGRELNRLSVGQRGTLYLCMKLATDPFGSPFVFDQPEDDLDNDFIVSHLIPLIRKVKKYRQVILVTHNANIVVNADAEQVIVAKNQDDTLCYVSGAIETQHPVNIRSEVCNILEGGGKAFRSRDLRYGQIAAP